MSNPTPNDINSTLAALGYSLTARLVKDHTFGLSDSADWIVTLTGPNGKTTESEYHTGRAHRHDKRTKEPITRRPSLHEWQNSVATPPTVAGFLSCFVSDSCAAEMTFEDWCGDFGYDTDSRKALDTYLACQREAVELRRIGANIEQLRELLADY